MKKSSIVFLILLMISLISCVDQSGSSQPANLENPRIISTSPSATSIFEKMDVDLIAVAASSIDTIPDRYKDLPTIGMAMSPDIEIIKSLNPDYVFGPSSLIADVLPKYEAANLNYGFLNLNNIPGMYKTIKDLGELLHKEEKANELIKDYEDFMEEYKKSIEGKEKKRVLILMGLPGSYLVATEHSYVGSLVEIAGCENVYSGTEEQFLTVNTEDIITKNPDLILRTSHAMSDEVMEMFKKDFQTNDIWKHFDCVKENKVYDLDHNKFGMSARFNYKEALEDLKEVLYGEKEN